MPKQALKRVVVVCGYGCNLDSPLKPYLNRVVKFCREQHPDLVVLCGGPTQQKSFPGKTEAFVMHTYLRGRFEEGLSDWPYRCYLEEESFTTYDNIRGAAGIIRDRGLTLSEITIFCEATRALKIARAARHFLGFPPEHGAPPIRIETDSWELMHPFWELLNSVEMELTLRLPVINWFRRWQRIAK